MGDDGISDASDPRRITGNEGTQPFEDDLEEFEPHVRVREAFQFVEGPVLVEQAGSKPPSKRLEDARIDTATGDLACQPLPEQPKASRLVRVDRLFPGVVQGPTDFV